MNFYAVLIGIVAATGWSGAIYSCYKKESLSLVMPLGYFSLMATLQSFSHTVAGECMLPANQVATLLAYLHLSFQPFFINAAALYFIERKAAQKIELYVFAACFVCLIIMLIQVYPFAWAGRCAPGSLMCGESLCTLSHGWHLERLVPVTEFANSVPWYFLALSLPLLFGSWRFMLSYISSCLLPAYLMTHSMNEWPGVCALLAIPFFLLVITLNEMRRRMGTTQWSRHVLPVER